MQQNDGISATENFSKGLQFKNVSPETKIDLLISLGEVQASVGNFNEAAITYHRLGCIFLQQNDKISATEKFLKGLQFEEASPETKIDLFISLGEVQASIGNFNEAIIIFNFALNLEGAPREKRILAKIQFDRTNHLFSSRSRKLFNSFLDTFESIIIFKKYFIC